MVADDVWVRLDPRAGRLRGRGVAMVWLGIVAAVVLSVGAAGAASAGVFVSRIDVELAGFSPHAQYVSPFVVTPGRITFTVTLRNAGKVPVTVTGLGSNARPLVSPVTWPLEIAPGRQVEVRLAYDLSNCVRLPHGPYTFPMAVRHWWGTEHSSLTLNISSLSVSDFGRSCSRPG